MPDGIETHAIIYAGGTPATMPGYMPSGKKIPKLECRLAHHLGMPRGTYFGMNPGIECGIHFGIFCGIKLALILWYI
jgi:hypothetical protein